MPPRWARTPAPPARSRSGPACPRCAECAVRDHRPTHGIRCADRTTVEPPGPPSAPAWSRPPRRGPAGALHRPHGKWPGQSCRGRRAPPCRRACGNHRKSHSLPCSSSPCPICRLPTQIHRRSIRCESPRLLKVNSTPIRRIGQPRSTQKTNIPPVPQQNVAVNCQHNNGVWFLDVQFDDCKQVTSRPA